MTPTDPVAKKVYDLVVGPGPFSDRHFRSRLRAISRDFVRMTDDSRKKVHLQGRIKDSVNAAIIHILDREYPCWNTRSAGYTNEVQAVINSSTVVVTHIYDEVKNAVQPGWLQIEDLGW